MPETQYTQGDVYLIEVPLGQHTDSTIRAILTIGKLPWYAENGHRYSADSVKVIRRLAVIDPESVSARDRLAALYLSLLPNGRSTRDTIGDALAIFAGPSPTTALSEATTGVAPAQAVAACCVFDEAEDVEIDDQQRVPISAYESLMAAASAAREAEARSKALVKASEFTRTDGTAPFKLSQTPEHAQTRRVIDAVKWVLTGE